MSDQRKSDRKAQAAGHPVYYRYERSLKHYGAILLNHGEGGICLQTGYEMTPGRRIRVLRLPAAMPDADDAERGRLGLITWCHKLPEFDAFFYKVGVAFIDCGE